MTSHPENPLRVVLGPEIWSRQKTGGISRYFNELADSLTRGNIDIVLMVPKDYQGLFSHSGINVIKVGGSCDFRKVLKRLRGAGHIYHSTYYDSKNLRYAKRIGFSTVVSVFDFISEKFPDPKPRFRQIVNEKIKSIELADRVICISSNTRKDLQEHCHIDLGKVSVVPLASPFGLNTSDFKPLRNRKNFVLYVGKRGGYKNFQTLLKAFSLTSYFRDQTQLIAFGGGEFTANELLEISSLGISSSVLNVQGTDSDLCMLYATAQIFVYPSFYEGFGLPLLEAMSFGCPVLASNTSSMPEVCDTAALYFNPDSPIELGELLESTLSNQSLLNNLSKLGSARSIKFSWEKTASLTMNVYKDLQQKIE